jgi:hypothetical protein
MGRDPAKWRIDVAGNSGAGLAGGHEDPRPSFLGFFTPPQPYSTLVGGLRNVSLARLAVSPQGEVYVGGTVSPSSPESPNLGDSDAFVTRLDTAGKPVYTIIFGGSGGDQLQDLAVDSVGNVYLAGRTNSLDFPIVHSRQAEYAGGGDAFACKLGPTGGFVYSTYLGGKGSDSGVSVAVDASGNAYVAGFTESDDFPVTAGAFQTAMPPHSPFGYSSAGFVAKLSPDGRTLYYSTLLAGTQAACPVAGSICIPIAPHSGVHLVAVDAAGSAYVAGFTNTYDFPLTPGAFQQECFCNFFTSTTFVAKLNAAGSDLVFSTYFGAPPPRRYTPASRCQAWRSTKPEALSSPVLPSPPMVSPPRRAPFGPLPILWSAFSGGRSPSLPR